MKRFPKRYAKLKEKVKGMTEEQARPIAERARITRREEVRV